MSCKSESPQAIDNSISIVQDTALVNPIINEIRDIKAPHNFTALSPPKGSYAHFLQSLPLKPTGTEIKYFDGRIKSHFNDYIAIIDLPIGNKDLHQCADAVIRLRADYLYSIKQYDNIHFDFTNGMTVGYNNWMQGQRIKVEGNNTSWYLAHKPSNTKEDYWAYLEQIWMYAGTLSLSKEMKSRPLTDIQIGDVFIQGGSPGHAIAVVNIARENETGETIVLLAQSYMPAQDMHILTNPIHKELSPWYSLKDLVELKTPEWTFGPQDLKAFVN